MSLSNSKGSSQNNSTADTSGTQSYTPNNLGQLQTGYNAAGQLLSGNDWSNLINQGSSSISGAAPGATALNTTAGNTAADFANGKYSTNGANQYLTPIANGSLVNGNNPGFQNVLNQFAGGAQAATDGSFGASGRYGSGANANAFNSAVANESGQLGYQNYQQQQQNQLTAAGLLGANNTAGTAQQLAGATAAPGLVSSMFTPGTDLSAAGYAPLAAYMAAITAGNAGGTGTSTGNTTNAGTASGSQTSATVAPKFNFGPFSFGS